MQNKNNKAKIKLLTNTSSFSQQYYYYSCEAVHVRMYSVQVQSVGTQLSDVDAISTATTRTEI